MSIQKLSPHIVNQIAAGEVIERPASVVKELVENSLDAGAKEIRIDLLEGGCKLIRVTDDGQGMPLEDLELAFASHATSKLVSVDQLNSIATLGFRGEALASIGAVSRARVISRARDAELGGQVENRGGEVGAPREAGAPLGTTVEVKDLFYNLPARRKFLKRPSAELNRIVEMVQRIALPFEGVGFTVKQGERLVLKLEADQDLLARIRQAFGKETATSVVPVESTQPFARLTGFLGLPRISRADTSRQFFYINGRFIRDRALLRALREGYRELLPYGRQPIAFLFLGIQPDRVDQNVHPTKSEVRFRDSKELFPFLVHAVKDTLGKSDLAVQGTEVKKVEWGDIHLEKSYTLPQSEPRPVVREASAPGLFSQPVQRQPYLQIHKTYLIRETQEGFEVIDQHALHERVLFEQFKEQALNKGIPMQKLLVPELVEMQRTDVLLVEDNKAIFQQAGFEVSAFGETTVAVGAIPSRLRRYDLKALLEELVSLVEGKPDTAKHGFLEEILHRAACRAAVMAGDTLASEEIYTLLEKARDLGGAQTCPHSRPTRVRFSLDELERAFHRK